MILLVVFEIVSTLNNVLIDTADVLIKERLKGRVVDVIENNFTK